MAAVMGALWKQGVLDSIFRDGGTPERIERSASIDRINLKIGLTEVLLHPPQRAGMVEGFHRGCNLSDWVRDVLQKVDSPFSHFSNFVHLAGIGLFLSLSIFTQGSLSLPEMMQHYQFEHPSIIGSQRRYGGQRSQGFILIQLIQTDIVRSLLKHITPVHKRRGEWIIF